jgi:hypothetical protein
LDDRGWNLQRLLKAFDHWAEWLDELLLWESLACQTLDHQATDGAGVDAQHQQGQSCYV